MSSLSVSVVTPSYNQSQFIRDTICSVANQTHQDTTHIIVDGGSDDGTLDILRDYDNLKWTSEPDRGQTHAINKGFGRSDGDVIGWLNSDDPYLYRDTVSSVVEVFERTGADIVYGHAITIGPDNEFLRAHYIPTFDKEKLQRHCYIMQPAVFFRDHVVAENELNEDREYSMDYEFWLDLMDEYNWTRLDRVLATDRNHPARKVIQNAAASRSDTRDLRDERGIERTLPYRVRQIIDKVDLRWRRVRGLSSLFEIDSASPETFAFQFQRQPLGSMLWTQLIPRKKQL